MSRVVLENCLPAFIALLLSVIVLLCVIRFLRLKWHWRRLRALHGCQQGGVQSLSFVVTLPIFLVIVLFIVQVSQLMVGLIVVHYAAMATARAAMVWIPTTIPSENFSDANELPPPIRPETPILLVGENRGRDVPTWSFPTNSPSSTKYRRIFTAAALACAPIAPSRDLGYSGILRSTPADESLLLAYSRLDLSSANNSRIPSRLMNKLGYSLANTTVRIAFVDKDTRIGPTYNPRVAVRRWDGQQFRIVRVWNPHEVGWQDPVEVTVTHHYALMPGPGRFLARLLVRADGQPDRVSPRIERTTGPTGEPIHTTPVWAVATLTNEGMKSLRPTFHRRH